MSKVINSIKTPLPNN